MNKCYIYRSHIPHSALPDYSQNITEFSDTSYNKNSYQYMEFQAKLLQMIIHDSFYILLSFSNLFTLFEFC